MSGESISLYELLNVSIGTPQVGAVNFGALRALLRAVLEQLDIQQATTRWSSAAPGDRPPDAAVAGTASEEDLKRGNGGEPEQQQEEEDRDAASSPTSSSSRAADPRTSLLSRLQSCEEDLSEVRKAILLSRLPVRFRQASQARLTNSKKSVSGDVK